MYLLCCYEQEMIRGVRSCNDIVERIEYSDRSVAIKNAKEIERSGMIVRVTTDHDGALIYPLP